MNPSQLDPQAVTLAKAIKRAETGDSLDAYNTKGASGEHGAYQFMPDTWKKWAGKHLGNDKAEYSVENQNRVAYSQIKEWKDQGYNPAQIASLWNSGNPHSYKNASTGINQQGVAYDVPAYVGKVSDYYRQLSGQQGNNQASVTPDVQQEAPQPTEQSYGGDIARRAQQGSQALGKLANGVSNGSISDIASGGLQTLGAAAGAVGDTVNAGLSYIPGYTALQDAIGENIVKPLAQSEGGQGVINSWQDFAQQNPDAAANIGAIGNIASVIPMYKAFSALKDSAGNALTGTFKSTIEKQAVDELKLATNTTIKGQGLVETKPKGRNPLDVIVKDGYIPDVVQDANGIPRYQTAQVRKKLADTLQRQDDELQKMLEEASSKGLVGYVPMEQLRRESHDVIKTAFADQGNVDQALAKANKIFDNYTKYKGDLVPLTEINKMKRGIREAVNFNSPKLSSDISFHLGQLFMKSIEDGAKMQGIPGVHDLNMKMASNIKADAVLKYLNDRSVSERPGWRTLMGRRAGDTATIAGEAVGQTLGVPGIGAFAGRALSHVATKGNKGSNLNKLKSYHARKKSTIRKKSGALVPLLQHSQPKDQEQQRGKT